MSDVYLDNKYVGTIKNAKDFVDRVISERRMGKLPITINCMYNEKTDDVFIEMCGGRCVRPLVVVKDGKPLLTSKHLQQLEKNEITWTDLVKQGFVDYLDTREEENALIAFTEEELTEEHTHLEVSP